LIPNNNERDCEYSNKKTGSAYCFLCLCHVFIDRSVIAIMIERFRVCGKAYSLPIQDEPEGAVMLGSDDCQRYSKNPQKWRLENAQLWSALGILSSGRGEDAATGGFHEDSEVASRRLERERDRSSSGDGSQDGSQVFTGTTARVSAPAQEL
jgi:hypothetical protein